MKRAAGSNTTKGLRWIKVSGVLRPFCIRDTEQHADLVVRDGRARRNRFGKRGATVPLPDGCYYLVRIDPPRKRPAKAQGKQT